MVLHTLRKRRSVREFKEKSLEKETIEQLVEAALRSPSSRDLKSPEFICVTDRAMLEKLSNCKPRGSSFLKGAPLGVVVYANPEKSDVWIEDCSIASIIIQLTAESMGLGSCWIQVRKRHYSEEISAGVYMKNLLGIPHTYKVEAIIAIGYADEQKPPHQKESLDFKKVKYTMQ